MQPTLANVERLKISSFLEVEVKDSNFEAVKLNTALPTARHRCNIFSKRAALAAGAMMRRWLRKLVTRFRKYVQNKKDMIFLLQLTPIFVIHKNT